MSRKHWLGQFEIFTAALIVRIVYHLTRLTNIGEGTNFPGRIVLTLFPNLVSLLVPRFKNGWVTITGTNGKTTTTKILVELMREHGWRVTTNARGANLVAGIVTSILLDELNLSAPYMADYAVFEIDEAVLIKSFRLFQPKLLVITNFSRDQLDRYGEVDSNVNRIMDLIRDAQQECNVVLNGNDPNIARIGAVVSAENRLYFGLKEEIAAVEAGLLVEKDTGASTDFEVSNLPNLDIWAETLRVDYLNGCRFNLGYQQQLVEVKTKLPGVFNTLNVLAAAAVCLHLGGDMERVKKVIGEVTPSYGRSERFECGGFPIFLFLVKNPVGFNHILQLLSQSPGDKRILLLLNDLPADGKDVSWIWDVSLENLWKVSGIKEIVTSGTRAGDMALRVKYSNPPEVPLTVDYSTKRAFHELANHLQPGEQMIVLANYTSMIQFRPYLLRVCGRKTKIEHSPKKVVV
ncbi:UDP-N-acetylmuramyl tripeptide synthase [Hydrogenispora ethanolica]|uniref:Lipid II isoglutaminyl synthase (glutamine-hydrolyzing) subunit MurT n=1 Tax=Hydrogenispora ethanolica TaxID=1082276 RepID=A0A4R1QSU9_HYDET|nr:Mur ligase family protein [Hydrogenispora ethanolica]TCL53924.1 UDP-N-acetylmuramyl tripeptide synthase [Hydrogenispora ethanolica]